MPRATETSLLLSLDDEPWRPSQRLFSLAVEIAALAPRIVHRQLDARATGARWFDTFPGEHYHLLTALSAIIEPAVIWEFGTDTGMSALALCEGYAAAEIFTVDVDAWHTKPNTLLRCEDFAGAGSPGSITQIVGDMTSPRLFAEFQACIAEAEIIFVDGPKDGRTEAMFLAMLAVVPFDRNPLVVFDDIRVLNMIDVWRGIQRPKMDLTSFGHFTGTGIVDWQILQ
jgi:predicted O-methyltransferase YrrM